MKTSSKYDEFHLYFRTREEFRTDPVPIAPECYLFTAGVILNKKQQSVFDQVAGLCTRWESISICRCAHKRE